MLRVRAIHVALCFAVACHAPGTTTPPPAPAVAPDSTIPTPSVAVPAGPAAPASPPPPAVVTPPPPAPITLALLDAMFADDQFVAELRSRLALTDDQIRQLRIRARAATAALTEARPGSTRDASQRAAEELSEILGDIQRDRLLSLVHERWSSDEDGNMLVPPAKAPGDVPTDTRIVINAPAYRMDIFRDGALIKSYEIGIGYPEFPLPTGLRSATSIIFNPTWTPPDEPWVKDRFTAGKRVAAGNRFNPLGPVKIPIGMPSLIHGGKGSWQLGGFASHGCVGLTDHQVREFADTLAAISDTPIAPAELATLAAHPDTTRHLKLTTPIPVELRYETIVLVAGKLVIYRDVYEHGTNTDAHLREVLAADGIELELLTDAQRAAIATALQRMALDAHGKLPAIGTTDTDNPTSTTVTRKLRGARKVVVDLGGLSGAGYPAPVQLSRK